MNDEDPKQSKVTEWQHTTGSPTLRIMTIGALGSYMKATLDIDQFINTCVPDTLLASFHLLSIKHLNIRYLVKSHNYFNVLMDTLDEHNYDRARIIWIRKLKVFKHDCFSNIKDHFPVIDKLVCAKVDYHQETPSRHHIYEKTLSKFRSFGDLRAFGDVSDPSLILVHRDVYNPRYDPCVHCEPPLTVIDDNKRKFELEVLLLGENQHIYMCFKLTDSIWIAHDNTRGIPFRYYNLKWLNPIHICSAIYVITTQAEDYKQGILETRRWTGTQRFALSRCCRMDPEPFQDLIDRFSNLSLTDS